MICADQDALGCIVRVRYGSDHRRTEMVRILTSYMHISFNVFTSQDEQNDASLRILPCLWGLISVHP
jgi:hypothetical protein